MMLKNPEEVISEYYISIFSWIDYTIFICLNSICFCVGIYFAFFRQSKTAKEYLTGGRNMSAIPVGLSLVLCYVSAITLMGTPSEMYVYGSQYVYYCISYFIAGIIAQTFFTPVFHNLEITTTFEYLEKRFDKRTRRVGSAFCIISTTFWLPIVIYAPALAFNQATGINIENIIPPICFICIFYTAMGGIRAVVWTDLVQATIMLGTLAIIIIKGTYDYSGGVAGIIQKNIDSSRLEAPVFNPDPTERHTFWSLSIGGTFYILQSGLLNQLMVQKFQTLPTLRATKIATSIFVIGMSVMLFAGIYIGMLIYAMFSDCDPITAKTVKSKDQLLPLLVMKTFNNIPGLSGLFFAALFSAAFSSMASGLNSFSAVILEDFCKPFISSMSQTSEKLIIKSVVVIVGILGLGLSFFVEKLGGILQLTITVDSIACGPLLALFTIGVFLPWINLKGVAIGGVASISIMSWIVFSAQVAIGSGKLNFPEKVMSVDGCAGNVTLLEQTPNSSEVFSLYKISYLWYTLIGASITLLVATGVSFCTGWNDPKTVKPELLSPYIRHMFFEKTVNFDDTDEKIIITHDIEKQFGTVKKPVIQ